jgi:hypothetical protein
MRANSVSLTEHTFSLVDHRLAAPRAAPQPSHLSCSPRPRWLYDVSSSPTGPSSQCGAVLPRCVCLPAYPHLSPPHSSHTFPNPGHNSCSAAPPLPPPGPSPPLLPLRARGVASDRVRRMAGAMANRPDSPEYSPAVSPCILLWLTCGVPALRPLPLQRGVLCVPVFGSSSLLHLPAARRFPARYIGKVRVITGTHHNTRIARSHAASPLPSRHPPPPLPHVFPPLLFYSGPGPASSCFLFPSKQL